MQDSFFSPLLLYVSNKLLSLNTVCIVTITPAFVFFLHFAAWKLELTGSKAFINNVKHFHM